MDARARRLDERGARAAAGSGATAARYNRVAVLLHWLIGMALLGQIAFGWLLGEIERGTPARALAINWHKSTGIILGIAILARLWWRLRHRPPAYPAALAAQKVRAAKAGHHLLYACMLLLPLSGYLASNFSKHGVLFLGAFKLPPWGPDDKAIYAIFNGGHDLLAIAFTVLVIGHIALGVYHARIARDGLFERMSLGGR